MKVNKLNEAKGFLKKYRECSIHDMGDVFVATNKHGLNIGQSKTKIGIEAIIDDYLDKEDKPIKESKITSTEPVVKFKGKSSHTFTKDKKWEVDFDEEGNILARTRNGKPQYFKGHINDKTNDFPSSDEDNIILAAKEQHGLKFGGKNDGLEEAFKPAQDGIQSVKCYNRYNYTIQELRVDNDNKTFQRGQFTAGTPDKKTKNRQEYEDIVDTLKSMGYKELDSEYRSMRNKSRDGEPTNESIQDWRGPYDEFESIIDKYGMFETDKIDADVNALYKMHKGEPAWDEAYRRWCGENGAAAPASKPLYVIKDSKGNQLSSPNEDDSELWDRVSSMEARGKRGLSVVAYVNESIPESKSTVEAFKPGDSVYVKPCKKSGKVRKVSGDVIEVETFGGKDPDRIDSYYSQDLELQFSDDSINESTNFDNEFYSLCDIISNAVASCGADFDDAKGKVAENGFSIVFTSVIDKADRKSFESSVESIIENALAETRFGDWIDVYVYKLTRNQVAQNVPEELVNEIMLKNAIYEIQVDGRDHGGLKESSSVRAFGAKAKKLNEWAPDMGECPACGDTSFDTKSGKCTKCSYRESMLNEKVSKHQMHGQLVEFVRDAIEHAFDNLAIVASSEVAGYDPDWCTVENSQEYEHTIDDLSKIVADGLLANYPVDGRGGNSMNESIKVSTIADYIVDHYDFDDIDDKYSCINSIRDSFKGQETISKEELEQFIGAHNGIGKMDESKSINEDTIDNKYLTILKSVAGPSANIVSTTGEDGEAVASAGIILKDENKFNAMLNRFNSFSYRGITAKAQDVTKMNDLDDEFAAYVELFKSTSNESLSESSTHCVYFAQDGMVQVEFTGSEDECKQYISDIQAEQNDEFGDESPERFIKKLNESNSLVDKKFNTLGKAGKPMYLTNDQLTDMQAKFKDYDFEETNVDKSLPDGQKAYVAKKKGLNEDVEYIVPKDVQDKWGNQPILHDEDQWDGKYKTFADMWKGENYKLEEASYGGAFDVEDDQFFTREEINEFAYEVCENLNEIFPTFFDVIEVYMERGNVLELTVQDEEGNEFTSKKKIDMRKIKKPSDLNRAYVGDVVYDIRRQCEGFFSDAMNESLDTEAIVGPDEGPEFGLSELINTAIQNELQTVSEYNTLALNARSEGFEDIAMVIEEINTEENKHIGQLQELLKVVSPNASAIDDGRAEGEEQLSNPVHQEI